MNPLTAIGTGTQALDLLKRISSQDPKNKKIVDYVLAQGLKPEEIAMYLSGGQGLTESQRSDIGRKVQGKENVTKLLDFLKGSAQVVGAGVGAYGLYRAGSSLARTVLGMPQAQSLAQTVLGIGGGAGVPPTSPPNAPISPTGSAPTAPQPTPTNAPLPNIGNMVKSVASVFGFKNKPLINAIAQIAEKTGQEVQQIHQDLKKNADISTPEKAAKAAQAKLAELTSQPQITQPKRQEIIQKVKTNEKTKDDLQSDLKSSVIRYTDYSPKSQTAKVVFNNGHTYVYKNVSEDVYQNFTKADTPAKTEGENKYGMWWKGKNPSLGASFNQHIKKGGYEYKRVGDTPFEKENYAEGAKEAKEAYKQYTSGEKKTKETALKDSRFKGETKPTLTKEQIRNRSITLKKRLDGLKDQPRDERNKELAKSVEERLQDLEKTNKLAGTGRAKTMTEELQRFETQQNKQLIKKMLTLLPATVVKVIVEKMKTAKEEDVLKMIKGYLTSSKK